MSFGFSLHNNNGQVIVSSYSYNLVYAGRATYVTEYDFPSYAAGYYASYGIPTPICNLYTFTFTTTASIIVPFFNCSGYCCLQWFKIASTSGSNITWTMQFSAVTRPTVYIFQPINPSISYSGTGTGVLVMNNTGGVSYLSTQPHIIPKIATTVSNHAIAFARTAISGGAFYMVWDSSGVYSNSVGSTSLTTPIIHYASPGSSVYYDGTDFSTFWFDPVVQYSGSNVNVVWGLSTAYGGTGPTLGQGAGSNLVIIAEGSHFT